MEESVKLQELYENYIHAKESLEEYQMVFQEKLLEKIRKHNKKYFCNWMNDSDRMSFKIQYKYGISMDVFKVLSEENLDYCVYIEEDKFGNDWIILEICFIKS